MTDQTYLSIHEAAKYLGVSKPTLRRWDAAGKLRPIRHSINGYRFYRRSDIERYRLGQADSTSKSASAADACGEVSALPGSSAPPRPEDAGRGDDAAFRSIVEPALQPTARGGLHRTDRILGTMPALLEVEFARALENLRKEIIGKRSHERGLDAAADAIRPAEVLGMDGRAWRRGRIGGPHWERDLEPWEVEPVVAAMLTALRACVWTSDRDFQARMYERGELFLQLVKRGMVRVGSDDAMLPGRPQGWAESAKTGLLDPCIWIHGDLLRAEAKDPCSREFARLLTVVVRQSHEAGRMCGEPGNVGETIRVLELIAANLEKLETVRPAPPERFDDVRERLRAVIEEREWLETRPPAGRNRDHVW